MFSFTQFVYAPALVKKLGQPSGLEKAILRALSSTDYPFTGTLILLKQHEQISEYVIESIAITLSISFSIMGVEMLASLFL
jgi:hypothetical protein